MRWLLVVVVGCTPQWRETLLVGPAYEDDHYVWIAQLEVAVAAHEKFDRGHNVLGMEATAGGAIAADRELTEEVVAGFDYLPVMSEETLVGFGAQAGIAHGAIEGALFVLPRLWFQVEVRPHWQLGLMLRGQLGHSGSAQTNARMTGDASVFAAGPMLVVAHSR